MTFLSVHSLASGSSGNAYLVRTRATAVLVDAGLSGRRIAGHLSAVGIGAGEVDAVLVTHEHGDHIAGLARIVERNSPAVVATPGTLRACAPLIGGAAVVPLSYGEVTGIGDISVQAIRTSHDAREPCGFNLSCGAASVLIATDTGVVTPEIRRAALDASLVVLEANYDPAQLRNGPYTALQKQRVASDTGHLSNEACGDLLLECLHHGRARDFWLAHLSRVNNSPAAAARTVTTKLADAQGVSYKVRVALRDHPSLTQSLPIR